MEEPPPEELEFIPWSDLLEHHRMTRPWMAYLLAGVLAAAGMGALVARAAWRPAVPPVPAAAVDTTPPLEAQDDPVPPVPALYREADLMAGIPGEEAARAAVRAEWFVTDYFTADGDSDGAAQVRAVLPSDAALPTLPQERSGPISYVEWARSLGSEQLEEGLYRVTVAFRTISGGEGAFRRLPVRAVSVVVGVDPTGGSAVLDLPGPVRFPDPPSTLPWPTEGDPAPEEILGAAIARAGEWGEAPEVVSSLGAGEGWRVVVEVGDEQGRRWPLVLWLDDAGPVPSPPWLGPGPP